MSNSNTPFLRLQDRVIDALLRAFSPARRACARAEQLISLNADGEATEAERRELEAHLERCPGCRALENATLLVRADLRERPRAALPETLAARLAATIADEQRRERVEALERGSKRRVAAPGLRLGLAGGVVGAVLAGFLTISVLHQSPTGHLAHPVARPVIGTAARHSAPPSPISAPSNLASVPRSHSIGSRVPVNGQAQPTNIASGEVDSSRPEIGGQTAQPNGSLSRRNPVQQQLNREEQVVAVKPAETGTFFPGRVKLPAALTINHAKPLHTGIGVTSHTVTNVPGNEVASTAIRPGKSDVFHFPAPGKSEQPDAQVAANDIPSQPLRQPEMQSSLTSELRNLAGGTQRAQIRSTKVTISLAAYPSNSGSTSNGASLVYAPANL